MSEHSYKLQGAQSLLSVRQTRSGEEVLHGLVATPSGAVVIQSYGDGWTMYRAVVGGRLYTMTEETKEPRTGVGIAIVAHRWIKRLGSDE